MDPMDSDTHEPPSDLSTELYWQEAEESSSELESQASTELYVHSSPPSSQGSSALPDEMPGMWGPIRLYKEASLDNPQACLRWCMRQGMVFAAMKCHRHRADRELKFWSDRVSWWCGSCRDAKPVFTGSVFAESRLPMSKLLLLAFSFAHYYDYETAQQTCVFSSTDTQPSSATIADWYGTFRDVLVDHAHEQVQSGCKIGGPGRIVQVDEALIGRRKYNRGRVVPGTWVVGLVDDQGDMRLEICPVRNNEALTDIIARHVHRGSDIQTDCWRGYSTNRLEWAGFTHQGPILWSS